MRKVSALFFFTLYLTSTTEASQLLKLPVILQHYHEHRQTDKQLSFFAFLDMHYMHGSPHDDDYDRDMQLPFKKADHHMSIAPVMVPSFTEVALEITYRTSAIFFIPINDQQLYCQYHHSIFQPPRFTFLV